MRLNSDDLWALAVLEEAEDQHVDAVVDVDVDYQVYITPESPEEKARRIKAGRPAPITRWEGIS